MAKAALMNREVEKGRALEKRVAAGHCLAHQTGRPYRAVPKGGREELAARETAEITTLEAYLPPPIDPTEIERLVDEAISETGGATAKDLGRVMKAVMGKLAGRGADGRVINEIVRRKLGS
jgi:uncharacterized protein YqeY